MSNLRFENGILKAESLAKSERLVGNIVIDSPYGRLVGYENHSGQTFLEDKTRALGNVIKGAGNNGDDSTARFCVGSENTLKVEQPRYNSVW